VLQRYEERQTCVLRTDLDGLVTVRSDGRRLEMDMARWSGDLGSAPGALLPRVF
jgi:beta-lactamase superfamily II metal-dependent hydrolase